MKRSDSGAGGGPPELGLRKKLLFSTFVGIVALGTMFGLWELLRPRYNFPRSQADYLQNDPILGFRHRPHAHRDFKWKEHPRGHVVLQTNNLGMRRDADVTVEKPPGMKRFLVTGDSHLDGVVFNDEDFSTIVEKRLTQLIPGLRLQVLNVATGHYGPDNYTASLAAYGDLSPDRLIVGLYTGNDFLDAADTVLRKRQSPLKRPPDYRSILRQAARAHDGAVAQLLNQTYYFSTFPQLVEPALEHIESLFKELKAESAAADVKLEIILIPTKWDVEPEIHVPGFDKAVGLLGLQTRDLERTSRMRLELASRLRADGIAVCDPTSEMRASTTELYWKKDFHLNDWGHRLLAEIFIQRFFETARHDQRRTNRSPKNGTKTSTGAGTDHKGF